MQTPPLESPQTDGATVRGAVWTVLWGLGVDQRPPGTHMRSRFLDTPLPCPLSPQAALEQVVCTLWSPEGRGPREGCWHPHFGTSLLLGTEPHCSWPRYQAEVTGRAHGPPAARGCDLV